MNILLTGGGTAGHVWPVLEVARSLQKNRRVKLLYIGSRQGIEKSLIKELNIPYKAIITGKRRAYFSFSNVWDIFKIFIGILQAFFILLFFRPKVIFAKGGYVTVPIIFWSKNFKIPLVIHESDAVMGRANLWAANKAQKICLGFPLEYYTQKLPLEKLIYTGIPINAEFNQTQIKTGERPKLLITGGSQGSSKINDLIFDILPQLLEKYEIFHVAGEHDFKRLGKIQHRFYHLYDFTKQMAKFMRDADLVIARAGASTLMEIAATSKPSIIIPLESAANNHQKQNAHIFFKNNAAVVLNENGLTSTSLLSIIDNLLSDKETLKLLGHHAHSFYQKKAAEEIVAVLFGVLDK